MDSSRSSLLASPAARNFGALLLLIAAAQFHPFTGKRFASIAPLQFRAAVLLASQRGLNFEDQSRQTAGYYEGLLQEGSRVSGVGNLITGRIDEEADWNASVALDEVMRSRANAGAGTAERTDGARPTFTALRFRPDFLLYDFVPGSVCGPNNDRTNSLGMYDKEYELEKLSGTWRIAMIGDSLIRGLGTRLGESFESQVEQWLETERRPDGPIVRYEVLNFGVDGYCLTQAMDVATTVASPFHPDVYLVAITELSVLRKWSDHVARLVHEGIDVKYPFLVDVVRDAGLRRDDSKSILAGKLEPFRMRVIRGVLATLREHALNSGARLVCVNLPTAAPLRVLANGFREINAVLDELGIARVDLMDAFATIEDLTKYRISFGNTHPNADGHRVLMEAFRKRLAEDAELKQLFTGGGLK